MMNFSQEVQSKIGLISAINPLAPFINKELFVDYAITGKECNYADYTHSYTEVDLPNLFNFC